jgi:hypothetical protein
MSYRQNYLERVELKKQCRLASGLVSEHFPEVSDIVIHMTYYQNAVIPILMIRDVNFWPSRHAYFKMDCMIKGCSDGGFDLTSVISHMIKIHKKSEKGKLPCSGTIDALASDHASIAYQITIKYNKA